VRGMRGERRGDPKHQGWVSSDSSRRGNQRKPPNSKRQDE
jgi:hypothetical protein